MTEIVLLTEDVRQDVQRMLKPLEALSPEVTRVLQRLEEAPTIKLPASISAKNGDNVARSARNEKLYPIGVGGSEYSYLQVFDELFGDTEEFAIDDVWEQVEPVIVTNAKRPRDAFRQAFYKSKSFRKVKKNDGRIWFRRVDPTQHSLLDDAADRPEVLRRVQLVAR